MPSCRSPRRRPEAESSIVDADGDSRFQIVATVTNESRWPLRVLGIPRYPETAVGSPPVILYPRITGLGSWPVSATCCLPEDATPFQPVTIGPNEMLDLVFVGRAGACGTAANLSDGGFSVIETVPVVYEQYTIVFTADVALSHPVNIPQSTPCSAEEASPSP